MPKIKGYLNILSDGNENYNNYVVGTLENDEYNFWDNDVKTCIKLNNEYLTIQRDNEEIRISMNFENNKKNKGTYEIKALKQFLLLETYTKKLEINENNISIVYDLYLNNVFSGNFTFNFDWSEE